MELLTTEKAPRLLSVTDVCEHLGISRWTVSKLVENGELKASKLGKLYKFKQEDIDAYVNSNAVQATAN